jgi:competence protein ComEC
VLNHYQVSELWYNGAQHNTQTYASFLQALTDKHINAQIIKAGEIQQWDTTSLTPIYPFPETDLAKVESNDGGIVTQLSEGSFDMLFTADISDKVETQLIAHQSIKPVEVLKVPHHGSRTSSSMPFLQALHPELAVISVGANNSYNHPNPETLARYEQLHIPVLRTDQLGTVELETDGKYYKVVKSSLF